ncbi:MAG: nitrile hydratase subunit beta [Pseudomonadales bacterium]
MNGIHDLGGMEGFGKVIVEANEPAFHAPWQSLAFRINSAAIGWLKAYNADEYRHAVERMEPLHYLSASYYERMLTGSITLLLEKGVLERDVLETLAGGSIPLSQPLADPAQCPAPTSSANPAEPRYELGQTVRVRRWQTSGHTRAPQYVQGKSGTIIHITEPFGYPDHSAHGLAPRAEPTLHVAFSSAELWGETVAHSDEVIVDLWQSYLEPIKGDTAP